MGHCDMASTKVQVVFCDACQPVFCNKCNGKALLQVYVSTKVLKLAELMCKWSGNGGMFSGLWCLDKVVQALVLFGWHSQG